MYKLVQYCHFTRLELCTRFYTTQQLSQHLCVSVGALRYTTAHKNGDFSQHVPNARVFQVSPSAVPAGALVDDQGIPYILHSRVNEQAALQKAD